MNFWHSEHYRMTSQKKDVPPLQRSVLQLLITAILSPSPHPLKVAIVCAPLFTLVPAVETESYKMHVLTSSVWHRCVFRGAVLQLFLSFPFTCPTSIFPLSWKYYDVKMKQSYKCGLLTPLMKASASSLLLWMLRQEDRRASLDNLVKSNKNWKKGLEKFERSNIYLAYMRSWVVSLVLHKIKISLPGTS